MNELFIEEKIYAIPAAVKLDPQFAHQHLVICRKSDIDNEGKNKLSEILNAINWKAGSNLQLVELEETEQVQLFTGLVKKDKRIVISFGLSPMELGLQTPLQFYVPFVFENAIVVFSHSVQELMNNKQFKGSLWNTIKKYKA